MSATPMLAASNLPLRLPQAAPSKPLVLVQDQPTEEELLRQQQEQQQQQEQAPAEPAPEPEAQPAPEPQPEPQPEPAPEPVPDQPAEQPQEAPAEQPQAEQPAPEQPPAEEAPAEPQPIPEQPAPEQPQPEQPQPEQPAPEQPQPNEPAPQQPEQPAPTDQAPQAPAEQAPAEQPPAEPAPEQPAPQGEQPPAEQPAVPLPAPNPNEPQPAPEQQPAAPAENGQQPTEQPAAPEQQPNGQSGQALPENAAPVLDSQKPQQPADGQPADGQPAEGTAQQPAQPSEQPAQPADPAQQPAQQPAQAEPAAPPPTDDRAAQQQLTPVEVRPVTAEQGTRVEKAPDFVRQERPKGADVLREVGDRIIIQINNQVIVESNDRPRMSRGARDVYYEDLPRGRTRETIVRENGVEIVTIRNRYGDVVRRSRIAPDGTEYILAYVDDEAYEDYDDWRDPGDDLPPMRLTVPVEDYILDAGVVDDPDRYYTFLDQPPVERVERLYSVDEVKRSARIRDKTRRVDLDTITFEFGSASIAESEVARLEGVANAMEKLLKKNPAETFLIEGHTDAVGTDVANLALSDRRAESVADALSNVFGIPPENLATQGYGERYLKIRSDKQERENRRVAIRRITPLVAPVASAKN